MVIMKTTRIVVDDITYYYISHIIYVQYILYNIISVVVAVTTPVAVSSVYGDKTRRVHT